MTDQRRRVAVFAAGAVSFALLASPITVIADEHEGMALVSEACQAASIDDLLKNPGRLTLSTDLPAYGPWWDGDPDTQYEHEPEGGSGWEVSDPYSGEGYESATAYAVAAALGFGPDKVDWVPNEVFELAFAPGEKAFDWHMAQTSIRPDRAENVNFTVPYFDANQSVIALTDNDIQNVTTIEGLKDKTLGAAVGTTSLQLIEEVVQPNTEPQVFSDNAAAVQALKGGLVDGLVVDLQSAFYMRDVQLEDYDTPEPEATIAGQFSVSAQADQMGMVMEKDSPLTECVNEAIEAVRESGQLQAIYEQWINSAQDIPTYE
jgi:polar amino acid transport system substrate-binding protein